MTFGVKIYDSNHPKIGEDFGTFSVASDNYPDENIVAMALEDETGLSWDVEAFSSNTYHCESKDGNYKISYLEVEWAR